MKLIALETCRSRCWPPTSQLFGNRPRRYHKVSPAIVTNAGSRVFGWSMGCAPRAAIGSSATTNEPDGGKHVAIADKA